MFFLKTYIAVNVSITNHTSGILRTCRFAWQDLQNGVDVATKTKNVQLEVTFLSAKQSEWCRVSASVFARGSICNTS